jgi:hypothetical protein
MTRKRGGVRKNLLSEAHRHWRETRKDLPLIKCDDFVADPSLRSLSEQIVSVLAQAATSPKYKGVPLTPHDIARAITQHSRMTARDMMVLRVRNNIGNAKTRVLKEYNTTIVREGTLGVRLAVDDSDKLQHSLVKAMNTVRRSIEAAKVIDGTMTKEGIRESIESVSDPEEKRLLEGLEEWHEEVAPTVQRLSSPRQLKLLTPGSKNNEDK